MSSLLRIRLWCAVELAEEDEDEDEDEDEVPSRQDSKVQWRRMSMLSWHWWVWCIAGRMVFWFGGIAVSMTVDRR